MPLISVCIPAYNRTNVLPDLLDSILEQEFKDFDIVIIEDSSPERSLISAKIVEYQSRFPGIIKYYENPHTLGYDGNLRRLVEVATGEYVLFMGNDDLLAEGALFAVANTVQSQKNVGVILRSYISFEDNPAQPSQIFRYFSDDRFFPPGAETVITFFRRCVFISGMVFKRSSALASATKEFDGTLLYQQHLVGTILFKECGIYLNKILSYHRLGGIPDFGASASEKGLFVPKKQTAESSIYFVRGMLKIAKSLDKYCELNVSNRILRDIGNYGYPILSIQSERSKLVFINYAFELMKMGLYKVPLFYLYAVALLIFGRKKCDFFIRIIKENLGRAPVFGKIYVGGSLPRKGD